MTTANEPVAPWGSFESLAVGSTPTAAGQTTRDMVHDLKNLLTPILGYVQLVLHDLPPTDAQYRRIEKIHRAALSATELVLHTLNDGPATASQSLNLNRRIRAFLEAVDGMIPENVRLESDLSANVGDVAADTGDLQRVLMNLIANACQAMPDGGTLRIQTARVAPPRTNAANDGFVSSADVVRITVQDTGGGIAPEAVGRIFESGYTTRPGGTGLGLACVQRIVRSYGGRADVDSIPNVGTAVHIFLPCTPPAVAAKVG